MQLQNSGGVSDVLSAYHAYKLLSRSGFFLIHHPACIDHPNTVLATYFARTLEPKAAVYRLARKLNAAGAILHYRESKRIHKILS